VTEGAVIDLATGVPLRQFSGHYTPASIGTMPSAVAGEISLALDLDSPNIPDTLSAAATGPYDRGLFLLRNDDQSYEEVIGQFQEAARLDPQSPLPYAGLVEAQILKYQATKKHKSLDQAHNALLTAESMSPDSPRVRLASGLLNETESQYEKALGDYRRVRELEPRNTNALLRMARVYDSLGDTDKAVGTYQEAIKLDPAYYEPYHALGVFYYYRGLYPQAAEQFQKSIDLAPGRAGEYSNLGAVLDDLGRDTEAEQALTTSLKLKETANALNSMGAMRAYQKRDQEAITYYQQAIARDPQTYQYWLNLGDSYRRLDRKHDARAAYQKGLELALAELAENPRRGYTRAFVAYFAVRLGYRDRAEEEIGQALRFAPNDNKVIRRAVLTYEALGERDRAVESLSQATPQLLRELDRQPDLADFRQDSRFTQLVAQISKVGK
jgi:tetratricopeptide (TPR) repeat protein